MSIESIFGLVEWIGGGLAFLIVAFVGFAFKSSVFQAKTEERLKHEEQLSDHFIKMGEDLKAEVSQSRMDIGEIKQNINWIRKALEHDKMDKQ